LPKSPEIQFTIEEQLRLESLRDYVKAMAVPRCRNINQYLSALEPFSTPGTTIQGCQIFLGKHTKNGENINQMTIKCTKWTQNIPNYRKIDQMVITCTNIFLCKLQKEPKFTQIVIFGLKINHLATLFPSSTL
jgi:hypothetical protein